MNLRSTKCSRLPRAGVTLIRGFATLRTSGLIWVLLIMCAVAAFVSDAFLNPFNLINVLRQIALFGIVSIGMTFVILTAGIDLSVGSIVAVVAVASRHDARCRHAHPACARRRPCHRRRSWVRSTASASRLAAFRLSS